MYLIDWERIVTSINSILNFFYLGCFALNKSMLHVNSSRESSVMFELKFTAKADTQMF